MERDKLNYLEALLFSTNEPLSKKKMTEILEGKLSAKEVESGLVYLQKEYKDRAFSLEEVVGGYLLRTKACYYDTVYPLFKKKGREKLTPAALEVLAIVAFKQPITKGEIEKIRGVDSSFVVQSLLEMGFVKSAGKKEVPGRPALFRTTPKFALHFRSTAFDPK